MAIKDKPTYKIGMIYGESVKAMHTAVALLDTRAGINLIHFAPIPPEHENSVRNVSLQRVRIGTKKSHRIKGVITLHLRPGDLCTRIWIGIAPQPAVNMLLGTVFIDCSIRGMFPSERKVVLW